MILYLAGDLVWATRIKRTAEDLGLAARPVRDVRMLSDRLSEGEVRALLLDLTQGEQAMAMLEHLSSCRPRPAVRVVAFGPHVERDLLERARAGGADEVLPRGAFDRNLAAILADLGGRGG